MKKILFALCTLVVFTGYANPGDTTHVISHNAVTVITDPNTGTNGYKAWAVFPSPSLQVRKMYVTLNFKCAPGMQCGAWDYLDHLVIRRTGSQANPSKDIDIVRFITAYGNQFNSSWNFNWHLDVSDYAMFLRDSVEIEYIHTGYEGTNVGWQITVDFSVIEGDPIANPIAFDQLWQGNFTYGDISNDIENYLSPDTVTIAPNTAFTKLRLLHTGHGSDANYCSEFCSKYRTVKIDGNAMNTRARWKPCGNNALYPQGGTWLYDRANWCPGSIVQPDFTTSSTLTPGSHVFDIDMQTYSVTSPSAVEAIDAQLFQYGAPNKSLDASIEEVYEPSNMKEYNRLNPICKSPQILIQNNGSTTVTSANIKYGIKGSPLLSYTWNGNLNFADTATVTLPNLALPSTVTTSNVFQVYIDQINNQPDQYNYDDSALVKLSSLPPIYDTVLLVVFRTNNNLEDSYYVTDAAGNTVFSRVASNLAANTTYYDTLHLTGGCYDISIYDSGGDGLSFWANTAQGTGLYRLKRLYTPNTIYLKSFNLDFGNFTKFNFFAVPGVFSVGEQEYMAPQSASLELYPNPSSGQVELEYYYPGRDKPHWQIFDGMGRIVKEGVLEKNSDIYTLNINELSGGLYWVKLYGAAGATIKKLVKQ